MCQDTQHDKIKLSLDIKHELHVLFWASCMNNTIIQSNKIQMLTIISLRIHCTVFQNTRNPTKTRIMVVLTNDFKFQSS